MRGEGTDYEWIILILGRYFCEDLGSKTYRTETKSLLSEAVLYA